MQSKKEVLILGIGNLLWADEGFGVRVIDALYSKYDCPENVTLMDGGTQGLYLVPYVQDADILIVFDAIDYGLAPGTIKQVHGDDVPKFMGAKKMSLHQTGFQEVLATAELLGDYPEKVFLIGVQPVELEDFGGSLREKTRAQIQPCIDIAIQYLNELGIVLTAKQSGESAPTYNHSFAVNHPSISLYEYEQKRPTAEQACRIGDERVLTNQDYKYDPKDPEDLSPNMSVDIGHRVKP